MGIFMQNHKMNTELTISKNKTSAGQLEHMKMPVFDGDIRVYPRFNPKQDRLFANLYGQRGAESAPLCDFCLNSPIDLKFGM